MEILKCKQCGRVIRDEFIEFDGVVRFCGRECATAFFDNDSGCVDILLEEGKRLTWKNIMKVFRVMPNAPDTGGFALCAANSNQEALELVNNSTDRYKKNYVDLYAVRIVALETNYTEPHIIHDCIYIEDEE